MSSILRTNHLNKKFGRIHAVQNLDLEIEEGTVFGLLGPNGSGKTTTLGMVLGVVNPSSGDFSWFDGETGISARKKIGAILERPTFYPYLSARKNLQIVAKIKGCGEAKMAELLELVNLSERADDNFKTYSLGMKQRLAIASALMCDPKVLVLDEPTNGLDPMGIAEIRQLITRIANSGKSIILASHLLDEVQKVCSHFAILRKGQLIHSGLVSDTVGGSVQIEVSSSDLEKLRSVLDAFPRVNGIEQEKSILKIQLGSDVKAEDLNQHLIENGVVVNHLLTRTKTLEEQFLEIVEASK